MKQKGHGYQIKKNKNFFDNWNLPALFVRRVTFDVQSNF